VVDQLPCAVKVLLLEIDRKNHDHLKDDVCPLIYYDFKRINQLSVQYLGKTSSADKKFVEILEKEFHINDTSKFAEQFTKDFTITAQWKEDLSSNFQFLYYDPVNDPQRFAQDLTRLLEETFIPILARGVEVVPDYNKIYSLKPDSILSESEILTKYIGMDSFAVFEDGKSRKFGMFDFQNHVSTIQLIPSVNEHVKRVFDKSKKLYIFGWYVYDFFPVAEHYAVLALESAIKHTYFFHFGTNVTIRNRDGKEATISNADYGRVTEFCIFNDDKSWNYRNLWIGKEKFLHRVDDLLDWLVDNKIITKWERKRCRYKMDKRNYLSHPTFSPIYPAGEAFRSIEEVTSLINKMFSSINSYQPAISS
ncbi:MAG: hypothetical protein ACREBA_07250, partial [Nitrosotalea sp.]